MMHDLRTLGATALSLLAMAGLAGCTLGPDVPPVESIRMDIRDVGPEHLEGFDGVAHLAGIMASELGLPARPRSSARGENGVTLVASTLR